MNYKTIITTLWVCHETEHKHPHIFPLLFIGQYLSQAIIIIVIIVHFSFFVIILQTFLFVVVVVIIVFMLAVFSTHPPPHASFSLEFLTSLISPEEEKNPPFLLWEWRATWFRGGGGSWVGYGGTGRGGDGGIMGGRQRDYSRTILTAVEEWDIMMRRRVVWWLQCR